MTVDVMRKKLKEILNNEEFGKLVENIAFSPDIASEVDGCDSKIFSLTEYLSNKIFLRSSNEYKYAVTKLQHVYGRLSKLTVTDATEVNIKNSIRYLFDQLSDIERNLDDLVLQAENSGTNINVSSVPNQSFPVPQALNPLTLSRGFVPVHKWGIHFSGDIKDKEGLSVNAFIERVEEYKVSRGVSDDELKNSISDLLIGGALIWHRLIKNNVTSWSHFIQLLKEEYLPFTFERDLKDEIRNSIQGPEETVGAYFARMLNLYNRLPNSSLEIEKVETIRQNMNPYYIHGLGSQLYDFLTVDHLMKECKKL
ncbi:hypothetical protein JTB14_007627 [Gonioctena quinquepunctata]|nr:hypothetical protein JTB14_007627 [Gonioctena quinquepunctata]